MKIMLSNGELVVDLRRQINFDRQQNAPAIDKSTDHGHLVYCNRLFSHLCSMIFYL